MNKQVECDKPVEVLGEEEAEEQGSAQVARGTEGEIWARALLAEGKWELENCGTGCFPRICKGKG